MSKIVPWSGMVIGLVALFLAGWLWVKSMQLVAGSRRRQQACDQEVFLALSRCGEMWEPDLVAEVYGPLTQPRRYSLAEIIAAIDRLHKEGRITYRILKNVDLGCYGTYWMVRVPDAG